MSPTPPPAPSPPPNPSAAARAAAEPGARPGLVVFDWGGVIVRICRTFEEGCRAAGLPYHPAVLDDGLRDQRRAGTRLYQSGAIAEEVFFAAASAATNGLYTAEEIARIHDAWLLEEYPGVAAIIDELNALAHVETALLSNTNARHWARQADSPFGRAFPTAAKLGQRFASHLLGCAKPDPAIYEAFEQQTGHHPAEILFFDDLAENIGTARARGWRAEQIDHTGDTAAQIRRHLSTHGVL